jgi:catechol 2,3-dioxygenase-like lactoylglutathione lyase family enzyme
MPFRFARHTTSLAPLIAFYTEAIGLQMVSHFEQHEGYDGVILGLPGEDWQVEFTTSSQSAQHSFDEDDALVFYVSAKAFQQAIMADACRLGILEIIPKNPYWQRNARALRDPDGYPVIIALEERPLHSDGPLTSIAKEQGLNTWNSLINYVQQLPYGRNTSRTQFEQVFHEGHGTCSTKHALLQSIAIENGFADVRLICGIYRMHAGNTPGIGTLLSDAGLDFVPEAHCYLSQHGKRLDITFPESDFSKLRNDVLEEITIDPVQVGQFKVEFHRQWMAKWISHAFPGRSLEEIWKIREACIAAL